jgi:hypothetical protein
VRHGDRRDELALAELRCPGSGPTGMVVAVRAAGGVAELRCTPVFM